MRRESDSPAILWNDGRPEEEVRYLNQTIGEDKLSEWTGNIAFAGFTAPKLLWVQKHEPDNFTRAQRIMLPKDYLTFKLTDAFCTDFSDAAGMLLLDVKARDWSDEMLKICSLRREQLADLRESYEVIGTIADDVAAELGLDKQSRKVKVVAGAGDNAAAAVGAGAVGDGRCNISIGTSGTVFTASKQFRSGRNNAVHNFAHADGSYHFLGCMLSAAACNSWWVDRILASHDYDGEVEGAVALGENNILFLPYLMGERSPHNNPNVRGSFLGLSLGTTRSDMSLAILEGVTFGLRDSLDGIREAGVRVDYATLTGGGAKSKVWQRIVANILKIEVGILDVEEGPALGSAILAAVGDGAYRSVEEACKAIVRVKETVKPDPDIEKKYDALYKIYKAAYPATRAISEALAAH